MRSPEPKGPGQKRRAGLLTLVLAASLAAGLGIVFSLWLREHARPVIVALDPSIGEPGGVVRVVGRNFGPERGEGKVEIAGISPTASSYLSWSDDLIELRVPVTINSGLVYVQTRSGRSRPRLFMNRDRLPYRPQGVLASKSGPAIDALSSGQGIVGSLLAVTGLNFGANRGDGRVEFAWTGDAGFTNPGPEEASAFARAEDLSLAYETWTDKEIRVRIPDGAATGGVRVVTEKGSSDAVFFRVEQGPGTKVFHDRKTYAVSYFVSLTKIKASGENDLYLWIPRPAESSSQRGVRALSQSHIPVVPDYRGVSIYRLRNLRSDTPVTVSQSFIAQVYAVSTDIRDDAVRPPPEPAPALYARYTAPDGRVPSADPVLAAAAKKAAGRERNPHKIAEALYSMFLREVKYTSDHVHETPLDAWKDKTADSYSMALLYCALLRAAGVPALPVSGFLIGTGRPPVRHYWVEYYLYGLGWVPVDPVLGSGADIPGFDVPIEDRTKYFGNLDNQRLAISRGVVELAPMTPGGRIAVKEQAIRPAGPFRGGIREAGGLQLVLERPGSHGNVLTAAYARAGPSRYKGEDMSHIESYDPELWKAMSLERKRQREKLELIASENYTSPCGHGGRRIGPDQQVRRRLSRQALLRRLRVRRHGGEPGPGSRQGPVRRRPRQRPAPFREARPTWACSSPP